MAGPEGMLTLDLGDWKFRYQSPPLTDEELFDIHSGINEIETGKSKRFTNLREALEWLNSD